MKRRYPDFLQPNKACKKLLLALTSSLKCLRRVLGDSFQKTALHCKLYCYVVSDTCSEEVVGWRSTGAVKPPRLTSHPKASASRQGSPSTVIRSDHGNHPTTPGGVFTKPGEQDRARRLGVITERESPTTGSLAGSKVFVRGRILFQAEAGITG